MERKGIRITDLFQEFLSSFNDATPEERTLLVGQFYPWALQQAGSLGILNPKAGKEDIAEGHKNLPITSAEGIQNQTRQGTFPQEVQNLLEIDPHFRQIAEKLEQVFWLHDLRSNRILYVNPAFEKVWGCSCESLYKDPLILIKNVHPEDRVKVMVARPHSDPKPYDQAYRIQRPDGSIRWIYARTFMIGDSTSENDFLFCIAQDITDQKHIELALRKTLDRTREQFDLSRKMSLARKPDAVLRTLMSADELHSARRAAVLFFDNPKIGPARGVELTASWQVGQDVSPWVSETNLYEEPAFWELLQSGRTVIFSDIKSDPRLTRLVRGFLHEGKIKTMAIFPLVTLGNWLGCLVVYYEQEHSFDHIELRHVKVFVDQATITLYNLQLLEIEEDSRHEAERANGIKTEFLAMISHELRTPLTSILGFTSTLLAEDVVWTPNEQHDFIQTIQQEADRLQELIDHLLDLSRLEAGMLPIIQEAHSLAEIIADVLPQFNSLTVRQTLAIHLPASLPPIYADLKRIGQVLVNLVRNASTYAPEGTEIGISASARGGCVQVNVIDQGPGIPPAEQKKVFEAFRRGINVEKSAVKGAGLGLAICKGLVEAHGGRIWIKKKSPPGTTIAFTIPIFPAQPLTGLTEKE